MTTIACDGQVMAGDGQVTDGNRITDLSYKKVKKLRDGRVAAMAGDAYQWSEFVKWLEDGGERPDLQESFAALVMSKDGVISFDHKCRSFTEQVPCAIGSGAPYAIAAMRSGKCPRGAVEIACAFDVWSGGEITVVGL